VTHYVARRASVHGASVFVNPFDCVELVRGNGLAIHFGVPSAVMLVKPHECMNVVSLNSITVITPVVAPINLVTQRIGDILCWKRHGRPVASVPFWIHSKTSTEALIDAHLVGNTQRRHRCRMHWEASQHPLLETLPVSRSLGKLLNLFNNIIEYSHKC